MFKLFLLSSFMNQTNLNLGGCPPIFKINNEQKKIISFGKNIKNDKDFEDFEKNKTLSIKDILSIKKKIS